jgi:hypothetical protein
VYEGAVAVHVKDLEHFKTGQTEGWTPSFTIGDRGLKIQPGLLLIRSKNRLDRFCPLAEIAVQGWTVYEITTLTQRAESYRHLYHRDYLRKSEGTMTLWYRLATDEGSHS